MILNIVNPLLWLVSVTCYPSFISHLSLGLQCGDVVSVFSDVRGKCLKGSTAYDGEVLHVGNGVAKMTRQDLFGLDPNVRSVHAHSQ